MLMTGIQRAKIVDAAGKPGRAVKKTLHVSKQIVRLFESGRMGASREAKLLRDTQIINNSIVSALDSQIYLIFAPANQAATSRLMANPKGKKWAAVHRLFSLETASIRAGAEGQGRGREEGGR
jgi:hypothetical protein